MRDEGVEIIFNLSCMRSQSLVRVSVVEVRCLPSGCSFVFVSWKEPPKLSGAGQGFFIHFALALEA